MARNYRQFPRRRQPPFGILKVQNIFGQENNVAALQTNTLPLPTTLGNTLIAVVTAFKTGAADPGVTMSDSKGNTWFSAATVRSTAGGARVYIFYSVLRFAGSSHTVTATANATAFISLDVMEYQGLSNFPLDQSNGAVGSSTTGATGNVTTTYPQNLYIAAGTVDTAAITFTANNGFTKLDQVTTGQNLYSSTLIGGAQTTQGSFAWSGTTAWATSIATFKPASASIFSTHWIHPVNQPLRNRTLKRQQPSSTKAAPFYDISVSVTAPSVSSWKAPVNQPIRRRGKQISIGGGAVSSINQPPYLSYWVQQVNQPLRKRIRPRQQPWYSGQEPFYGIFVAAPPPVVSAWKQPTNQPLRNRVGKRQQVARTPINPPLASQAPYISYWVHQVNQPLKNRVSKRQIPGRRTIFEAQEPATEPADWIPDVNQPLRSSRKKLARQMPYYNRPVLPPGAVTTPPLESWQRPTNQFLRKRTPKRQYVAPKLNPIYHIANPVTLLVSTWIHPINQFLRKRLPRRQQPDYTRNRGHFDPIPNPPPNFTPITLILSSLDNHATEDTPTNLANASGGVTISNDNSPTNQSSVNSDANDMIISSGPNQETLEG